MQGVMSFVKTHLISLLCGVAGLAFIAMAVLGMSSTAVSDAMDKRLKEIKAAQISGLRSAAKNQSVIEAERRRGERFEEEYGRTVAVAHEINKREPLREGIFPRPTDMAAPLDFVQDYEAALKRLPRGMIGGTLPTASEIQEEQENVQDLLAQLEERRREEQLTDAPPATGTRTPPAPSTRTAPVMTSEGMRGAMGQMTPRGGGFEVSAEQRAEPRFNAVLRANVAKARSIRVYYNPATFHESPIVANKTRAPTLPEMWSAQVSLWVQQDVVKAIEELNEEFAKTAGDGDVYVEHSPVKHLVAVRVHGYRRPDGKLVPFPASIVERLEPSQSFIDAKGDEQFDVVRFTVQAVVDQRHVLRLVDAITRANFYRCVNIRYEAVPAEHATMGYQYGTAPVVLVTVDFEGFMARAIYDPWMPPAVRSMLGGEGG